MQINLGNISEPELIRLENIINAYCMKSGKRLTKKDFFLMLAEEKEIELFGEKKGHAFHYSEAMKQEEKKVDKYAGLRHLKYDRKHGFLTLSKTFQLQEEGYKFDIIDPPEDLE